MNRIATAVLIGTALVVTACGENTAGEQSTQAVVADASDLTKPLPGQYSSTFELVDFDVPGMPEAQMAQLRGMFAENVPPAQSLCMTQADVDKGFEDMVRKMGEGANGMACTFDRFNAAGSELNAALTCNGDNGVVADMRVDGMVEPERFVMTMNMTTRSAQIPGGQVKVGVKATSQRTGDCT